MIALLTFVTIGAFAQTAPVGNSHNTRPTETTTANSTDFKPDPKRLYDIKLQLDATAVKALIMSPAEWEQQKHDKQLSVGDYSDFEDLAKYVRSVIVAQVNAALQADKLEYQQKHPTKSTGSNGN